MAIRALQVALLLLVPSFLLFVGGSDGVPDKGVLTMSAPDHVGWAEEPQSNQPVGQSRRPLPSPEESIWNLPNTWHVLQDSEAIFGMFIIRCNRPMCNPRYPGVI